MSRTSQRLIGIIESNCEFEDAITDKSHLFDDLGIDSLDFLDVTYDIEKEFGVALPIDEWMENTADGRAEWGYFVFSELAAFIENRVS